MVFSSLNFVLIFMPVFFACYYIVPDKWKNAVLLIGSLSFYLVGTLKTPYHFALFVLSIIERVQVFGLCIFAAYTVYSEAVGNTVVGTSDRNIILYISGHIIYRRRLQGKNKV